MTGAQRSVSLAVALVLLRASPALSARFPNRLRWEGALTRADGVTGRFTARTRLGTGRVHGLSPIYLGRFRCRGVGCPTHRGRIELYPLGPGEIDDAFFGSRRPRTIHCVYSPQTAPGTDFPPDYGIAGPYVCRTVVPPEPPPVRVFSEGVLHLIRRVPPN